jgi:hypothetical protein
MKEAGEIRSCMSCTIVWNDVSDGILNSNKNKNADGLSFSSMNRDVLQIKKNHAENKQASQHCKKSRK